MPASDYQAGGIFWTEVQNVMTASSCSRLRAVSALKVSCACPAQTRKSGRHRTPRFATNSEPQVVRQ
jgi:hypothetical protein